MGFFVGSSLVLVFCRVYERLKRNVQMLMLSRLPPKRMRGTRRCCRHQRVLVRCSTISDPNALGFSHRSLALHRFQGHRRRRTAPGPVRGPVRGTVPRRRARERQREEGKKPIRRTPSAADCGDGCPVDEARGRKKAGASRSRAKRNQTWKTINKEPKNGWGARWGARWRV